MVITALAPMDKQANNYLEHFADAGGYDPKRDVPEYVAARIQRLTVSDAAAGENVDWKNAQEWEFGEFWHIGKREMDTWATRAPEPVDPRFVDRALAKPLGPLAFRDWGRQATHPEIPLAPPKVNKGSSSATPPPTTAPTPGLRDNSVPGTPRRNSVPSADNSNNDFFGDGNTNNEKPSPQEQPADPPTAVNTPTSRRVVENRLVRIFDYDVEPGKMYLYRIQLALKNPNFKELGIDPRFLEDPARMQTRKYRESAWSQSSNAVRVPDNRQVYMATIGNEEGDADNIIVREIDFDKGEQRTGRISLQPGEIANQTMADEQLQQGKGLPEINNNNPISTDLVLLDEHGGEPLGGFGGPPDLDQDQLAPEQAVMTCSC